MKAKLLLLLSIVANVVLLDRYLRWQERAEDAEFKLLAEGIVWR